MCRRRGFTLYEVLVAVAVSGLVLVSLVGLFLVNGATSVFGLNRARATQLAELELTRRKLSGYTTLEGLLGSPPPPWQLTEGELNFTQSVQVERLSVTPGTPEYSLLRVKVTVDWKERRNQEIHDSKLSAAEAAGQLALESVVAPESLY